MEIGKMGRGIGAVVGIVALGAAAAWAAASSTIDYPEGYRGWTHVKSMVLEPDHPLAQPFEGIHHVYANDEAVAGLEGRGYADGATFVFDLLEAREAEAAIVEGPRKLLGVMVRDASRFEATGGWGFEAFAGSSRDDRLVTDGGVSCFGCHTGVADRDHVFSELRDGASAP